MMNHIIHKFSGNKSELQKLRIHEAIDIAATLGIPIENYGQRRVRRVERIGLVILALGDIKPDTPWSEVKDKTDNIAVTTRDIIKFVNEYYGESLADSSYDDFKRIEIDLLLLDSIVMSGFDVSATNDSRSGYCLCPTHAAAVRTYGTDEWGNEVAAILSNKETLRAQLDTTRKLSQIPVILPHGVELNFSSGKHNDLQKAIIEKFLPRFGYRAEVLYVGDTTDKYLFLETEKLLELRFPKPSHEELPDIIAVSHSKKWLYLIEAVTSSGEINQIRKLELEAITTKCNYPCIFVTAFLDKADYRRFAANLAWETEIWIANEPDHLIHLNGEKFLGPYQ